MANALGSCSYVVLDGPSELTISATFGETLSQTIDLRSEYTIPFTAANDYCGDLYFEVDSISMPLPAVMSIINDASLEVSGLVDDLTLVGETTYSLRAYFGDSDTEKLHTVKSITVKLVVDCKIGPDQVTYIAPTSGASYNMASIASPVVIDYHLIPPPLEASIPMSTTIGLYTFTFNTCRDQSLYPTTTLSAFVYASEQEFYDSYSTGQLPA